MARKPSPPPPPARTTPVKPPTPKQGSIAGKGLAKPGALSPAQVRTLAGRVAAEREAVIPDKPKAKPKK